MTEICTDNRFEIIADYKRKLIEETNIETRPEEMAVLDSILFRFWQMGWLTEQERVKPTKNQSLLANFLGWNCGACGFPLLSDGYTYCPRCGRRIDWNA